MTRSQRTLPQSDIAAARPAFVLTHRWCCLWCEAFWLSQPLAAPACPQCGQRLTGAGLWVVERHGVFPWWLGHVMPGGYVQALAVEVPG